MSDAMRAEAHSAHAGDEDYDAIVIGAGHNALVCAAYLARAGWRVGVFERGDALGGATASKELLPGYAFDVGASAHSFIHLTAIMRDLALDLYGLRYIALDPLFFLPFPDERALVMWRSVERTCASIAQFSAADAERYRRFCREWTPFALLIADLMMTIPTPAALAGTLARSLALRGGWRASLLPRLRLSIRQFLDGAFESEQVKALLGWLAAQVGVSPDQPGGAVYVVWQAIYHVCGITMPRGGSGMLARALANAIVAHGGEVRLSMPVRRILVERGRAVGVETALGQRWRARRVVSGAHIKTTAQLLGDDIPEEMARRIGALKTTNGSGVALRIAARGLPAYRACANSAMPADALAQSAVQAIQLIAPSLDYVGAAWSDFQRGVRSRRPLLSVITPSAADPTRAQTISIWAQYYPHHFGDGARWDDQTEALIIQELLETLAPYAPNIRDVIVDMRLQTPATFESELGLLGGDLQHIQVTPDQMFLLRPGLGLSAYRTPIERLYLTGASTHPGGGVTGMPGRNAARAILVDG